MGKQDSVFIFLRFNSEPSLRDSLWSSERGSVCVANGAAASVTVSLVWHQTQNSVLRTDRMYFGERSWPEIGSSERSLNDANNDALLSLILIHALLFK